MRHKIITLLVVFTAMMSAAELAPAFAANTPDTCGRQFPASEAQTWVCSCPSGIVPFTSAQGTPMKCCGYVIGEKVGNVFVDQCSSTADVNPVGGVSSQDIDLLNPLIITGSTQAETLSTPGGIVSRMLSFIFPIAGLILFAMISWGGFEILISASGQKGMEAGKNRITTAIVGFILLFSSYWMAQIVEAVFGIKIL